MTIKKASIEDLDSAALLFDLYRQFYKQTSDPESAGKFLGERLNNNDSVIFLAMDEHTNKGMGFIQLFPLFSSLAMKRLWLLNDLYVHEDYRKMGVGEALMKKAEELAFETGAKGIFLQTHNTNLQAQNLYYKSGYNLDKEFFTFYFNTLKSK